MHAPPAFGCERNVVRRIIHLRLQTRSCLEPPHGYFRRAGPKRAQPFPADGVTALEAQPAQLFLKPHRSQIRVALHELHHLIRVRVEQTRPMNPLRFPGAGPLFFVLAEYAEHALAMDTQQARDGSLRSPCVMQTHDLIAGGFIHAVFNSRTRSRLSAATDPASRDSLSKRGARITRSSAVSPARP